MDVIDERELRNFLTSRPPANVVISHVMKQVLDESRPWDDRRPYWHFLHQTGRAASVVTTLIEALKTKTRVPFNVLVRLLVDENVRPEPIVLEAVRKGLRKQRAQDDAVNLAGWERLDPDLAALRERVLAERRDRQELYKRGLLEKFEFLRAQRMNDQAARVLRRMIEIYPEESALVDLRTQFEEDRARDVLANRRTRVRDKFERTQTVPSTWDQQMLKCFVEEGLKILVEKRELAADLAVAFWFMDDYPDCNEMLAWAAPSRAVDWMRAESLFQGRRFLDCLEAVNTLEIKYGADPETTFAATYLRAQCLRELGQEAAALEMMRSLIQVRPNYRSAHALILEWADGNDWE